ncbi:MAG: bifunctional riboflavin kinase/FAD synthetase [Chloroflexota bacterium]
MARHVVMQIEELDKIAPKRDTLLTVGVFDGIHLGHKYLIARLIERAKNENLLAGVVTFKEHPRQLISPENRPRLLASLDERIKLLKDEGVDFVVALSFTPELANLTARDFVSLLKKHLRMRGLIIGPDFALGRNREGNIERLRRLGEEMGFTVTAIPPVKLKGETVSSTTIRKALADGDMRKVSSLLGRSFYLQGEVISGVSRGQKLGFPTANLEVDDLQAVPQDGVYATRTRTNGEVYKSVTNIGWRPTFQGKERTIETHLIDYRGDLYGKELKIDIIERLRGEKRFKGPEELKKQITEDIKEARRVLGDS